MSDRLYYHDAATVQFTADIVEQVRENGRLAIVLDRSYFYPASGGQPADWGQINGVSVVGVTIRLGDEAVLHWLEGADLTMGRVTAVINWQRRFNHMQHHTGQHILSQAFIHIADAQTVGFHLSGDSVTIDLAVTDLTADQIRQAEQLANQIVWENRPVNIQMVTLEQARQMPLRKLPPVKNDRLRLIEIEDFDLTACGGTHVAQTGAVGLVKIIRLERRRGKLRVEFRCGGRALADYDRKNDTVNQLMSDLTTGQDDLVTAVARLQTENKESHRVLKKMRSALLHTEAKQLLAAGQKIGAVTIIMRVFDGDDDVDLRVLGHHLTEGPNVVALLGMVGTKSQLLFCRSDDAPGEMNELLNTAWQQLGKGGGGGTAVLAQGGGPAVANGRLLQALTTAKQHLLKQLPALGQLHTPGLDKPEKDSDTNFTNYTNKNHPNS